MKRKPMTAEARARISEAMKRRHAEKKNGTAVAGNHKDRVERYLAPIVAEIDDEIAELQRTRDLLWKVFRGEV